MTEPIIRIQHLCKTYSVRERAGWFRSRARDIHALRDVSLEIASGALLGLLGPNGAGKTTLIKCLTTLLIPTSGEIWINGLRAGRDDNAIRAAIGCMLMGERGLYWKLTGRENLEYFAALYFVPRSQRRARVSRLIDLLRLGEIVDRPVESYSSGQRMKLAFAKSLVQDAPILILDEPTATLDVPTSRELRAIVRELNRDGRTILYTTHQMAEAEELCQRVAIIDQGRIIAEGSIEALKGMVSRQGTIRVEGVIPPEAYEAARVLPGVLETALSAQELRTRLILLSDEPRTLLPGLLRALYDHGASVEYVSPGDVTLEDVFLSLTGRTLSEDTRQR